MPNSTAQDHLYATHLLTKVGDWSDETLGDRKDQYPLELEDTTSTLPQLTKNVPSITL